MMKQWYLLILFLNVLTAIRVSGQTVPVPDSRFLAFLKDKYSSVINSKDELIIAEAAKVTGIFDCSNLNLENLEGIQYFTGITTLDLDDNKLTDVSGIENLKALQSLRLENNYLTSLPDLSMLTDLKILVAYDNQLQQLPDLSANIQLTQLVVYKNQLKELPDLRSLVNLQKLDAGNNRLTVTPDVSANILLTSLSLDKNFLTHGPELSDLPNLSLVELNSNYLSFEDLLPYISYPGFSSRFVVTPQKDFPLADESVIVNSYLKLSTGIDTSTENVTYTWYYSGKPLPSVSGDSLVLDPVDYSDEGYYYCVLSHPSFPGISLKTTTMSLDVVTCPVHSDFTFEFGKIGCFKAGTLKVSLISMPSQEYTFYLQSPVSGDTLVSQTGFFNGLNQPEYMLSVKAGSSCEVILPDRIVMPFDECNEIFITPNGDGDKDSHFFSHTGSAVIYDKNGNPVIAFPIPAEWDGSSGSGMLVAPGYYSADINHGENYVNITVLY